MKKVMTSKIARKAINFQGIFKRLQTGYPSVMGIANHFRTERPPAQAGELGLDEAPDERLIGVPENTTFISPSSVWPKSSSAWFREVDSTRTVTVFPTRPRMSSALTACWSLITRSSRSFLMSSGIRFGREKAFVPSRGL